MIAKEIQIPKFSPDTGHVNRFAFVPPSGFYRVEITFRWYGATGSQITPCSGLAVGGRIWEHELQKTKKCSTPHLASGHPLPGRGGEGEARLVKKPKSLLK